MGTLDIPEQVNQRGKLPPRRNDRDGRNANPNVLPALGPALEVHVTHPAELFALLKMRAALAALGKPVAVASLDHIVATSTQNFFRRIAQQGFRSLVPGDDAMLRVHGKHAVGSVGKLVEELGDWLGAVLR